MSASPCPCLPGNRRPYWPLPGRVPCWLAALVLLLGACGGRGAEKGPAHALERYIAAVEANRPGEAFGLLDPQVRRQTSEEEFTRRWREARPELLEQVRLLKQELASGARIEARVVYPSGASVEVSLIEGRWQVASDLPDAFVATTVNEALRAFVSAAEQGNVSALMSLLSESTRKRLEREIQDRIALIKAQLDQDLAVEGDRAVVRYAPGRKVTLIKEKGRWRISDIE